MRAVAVALALTAAACPGGKSTGMSSLSGSTSHWEFPLVGPLEDGLLLTPVTINGMGPYLMLLDPDARISVIDAQVAKDGKVVVQRGPLAVDETGQRQPTILGEIFQIELGNLIIDQRTVSVVRLGAFDIAGRRVAGVIGSDILDESLVLGIDRDRGVATLTTPKTWKPPASAIAIGFDHDKVTGELAQGRRPRRVAKAQVGGDTFAMHLDLGGVPSQLREPLWQRAGLVARDVKLATTDELGTVRTIERASEPVQVQLGAAAVPRVAFIPYIDKRAADDVDGSLGLGFFAGHKVTVVWSEKKYLLERRAPVALAKRIERWDTGPLMKCKHPACIEVRIVDPLNGQPPEGDKPHPGVVLSLTRDERAGGMGLELVLEATGQPELPRLIVNLPPSVDRHIDHLSAAWVGVPITVVDASPYPRACPVKASACVDQLAR
jgi:hypothetical protein